MKRGPKCKICSDIKRSQIDVLLARGVPNPHISRDYGFTVAALWRHKTTCIPTAMAQVVELKPAAMEKRDAYDLVAEVDRLQAITLGIIERAEADKHGELALKAISEARRNIQLIGRLTGTLEPKDQGGPRLVSFVEFEALYLRARQESRRIA